MKVYRVENPANGLGPFQNGAIKDRHLDPPGPASDGVFGSFDDYLKLLSKEPKEMAKYHYGFQTKTKLTQWFNKNDLKTFEGYGSFLYEYELPKTKVKLGNCQCAFKKEDAYSCRRVKVKKLFH